MQLSHSVNPELMFSDYCYVTGVSKTMREYCESFAQKAKRENPGSQNVLDIACNDGTQLDYFAQYALKTFGVDPAGNLCEVAKKKGHTILNGFFPDKRIGWLKFDIITAQNVFAHTPDPYGFLIGCAEVMHNDSVLYIQTSQADMLDKGQFDTIYHEHISFFNVLSMKTLVERAGLHLNRVEKTPIHGTSYVFTISLKPLSRFEQNVDEWLIKESDLYTSLTPYYEFGYKSCTTSDAIKKIVYDYKENGYSVVGYGAAAKGINTIAFTGVLPEYIVDDTQLKQNKFTPGTGVPIYSSDRLKNDDRKLLIIPYAWNFYDEIKGKVTAMRPNKNDKFLRYFPKVEVK